MADRDDLDELVDANDLVEVARATRVLVLRLDGIKGQNGVLSRIESASEALEKIDEKLITAVERVGDVSKFGQQIEQLPDRLLSKVNSLTFRSAISQIMSEETGTAIEKIQDATLDHLESGVTRLADRLARLADRLADDLFTKKLDPAMRNLEALARLKQDRVDYRDRAENAEKALSDFQALSQKTGQSIIDRIERIRLSSKKPNLLAAAVIFAAGWVCAVFAAGFWSVITAWLVQQPIPAWFLPRSF